MSDEQADLTRYPIAWVEWVDSGVLNGMWEPLDDVLERVHHREPLGAAGLLVDQTDEGIILCAAWNPNLEHVVSCVAIPRVAITRLELCAPWAEREGHAALEERLRAFAQDPA